MFDRRKFLATGALGIGGLTAGCATPLTSGTAGGGDDRTAFLLDDVHERTFRFFWDTTDPRTGLAPDRWPTPSFASVAAVGFALTAYPIGVTRGWITREQARDRTLTTLRFFDEARQGPEPTGTSGHKGFFYHFLDMRTGHRFGRTELSTVDTALLLGGILFAAGWFDGDHADEARIRDLADRIYGRVEWDWITPAAPFVSMGWHPESGFIPHHWDIYNEAMLLYVLALGSPTHPLPGATWGALTERFDASWTDRRGQPHLHFAPMFGHQYSHVWVDFRGIRDPYMARRGIDYFENSRRATHAQRAYAIENPGGWRDYGANIWGLTACDGPGDFEVAIDGRTRGFHSYSARGPGERDDGTLAPTALLGSLPFAPEIVEPAVAEMHHRYGRGLYGRYGFLDSVNPTMTDRSVRLQHGRVVPGVGWVADDYLGIDQGAIVTMVENHRSGLVWEVMRRNPHIRRGLVQAGFTGGWLA